MPRYRVIGLLKASLLVGEYEADSNEQAVEIAEKDIHANWFPSLCPDCANGFDIDALEGVIVEKIEPLNV